MMIVLANVVANDGADISHAVFGVLRTVVADQQKSAFIVVAVVVLDDRVAAVPVGIKPFGIMLAFGSIHFVVLDEGVVRAPWPDADVVILRALARVTNHVVLNNC